MRIIAGQFKGRKLHVPEDRNIRPTSDRTRESLFNLIMHGSYGGENVTGVPIADICCGTGALGFEALSRGAKSCIFIDNANASLSLAKKNAEHLGVTAQCTFLPADASALPVAPHPCGLILMDAPYNSGWLAKALESLQQKNWLAPNALLVIEQHRDETVIETAGLTLEDRRDYGKASLRLYRA